MHEVPATDINQVSTKSSASAKTGVPARALVHCRVWMVELFRHQKWGCPGCLWGKSVLGASQACSVNILLTYIYPLVPVSLSASIGDDSSLSVGWLIQRQYTFDSVRTRANVLIR